jgi:hypothetical protein
LPDFTAAALQHGADGLGDPAVLADDLPDIHVRDAELQMVEVSPSIT